MTRPELLYVLISRRLGAARRIVDFPFHSMSVSFLLETIYVFAPLGRVLVILGPSGYLGVNLCIIHFFIHTCQY